MWKTGEIMGYRWEAITNNNKVVKISVHKAGQEIKPGRMMKLYINIMAK